MDKPGTSYPNLLRFDLTPTDIEQLASAAIAASKKALDAVAATASNPSWEATIQPLMDEDADFSTQYSNCYFPSNVSTDKAIRDTSTEANKKLEAYSIEKDSREDVYLAVKAYTAANPIGSTAYEALTAEQKFVLKKTLQGFERNGLQLPKEKRTHLQEVKTEISSLAVQFQQNLNEDVTTLTFTKAQLEGLSDDFIEALPKKQQDGGGEELFVVSLKYPELLPVLKRCKVEETRKAMAVAKDSICKENGSLLEKAVVLRQEEAELLGFEDHASFVLDVRMAKNSETVFKFVNTLSEQLEPGLDKDLAKFLQLKKADKAARNETFDGHLYAWDRLHYDDVVLQQEYNIDDDVIADYFPLEHVTKTLLDIYQHLFGFKISETVKPHVWHVDVKQFDVYDSASSAFVGHLYLDLHPRDGKYGHAAEFGLQKGCVFRGKRQHPAAAMVANFTKPTADKSSLLKHDEVQTYAHELGHAFHELSSVCSYALVSGTNVQRDFVEAPSQLLENFVYEPAPLKQLSKHYKTGGSLPEDLIAALIKSRNANIGTTLRRQIFFATFDMVLHTLPRGASVDTAQLWHDLMAKIMKVPPPPGTNGAATFGHMMGGYSAAYYGYLWSDVYSAAMYKKFKDNGVLSAKVGKVYREKILAPGGSKDGMDLLVDFLGQEPTQDAFLERIGLKSACSQDSN